MRRNRSYEGPALISLLVLGLILGKFQTGARNSGHSDLVTTVIRGAVAPASNGMTAVANSADNFVAGVAHGRALAVDNERLRALAAVSENYSSDIERLEQELDEARHQGGWIQSSAREKVPADVTGFFPHENRITINVGADRGIKRGMPVATYEGLVGRVETVDRSTSQVLLITASSTDSRITAVVQRKAPNPPPAGVIRGESANSLVLELADPTATVESGDIVSTSGFSEEIPRGIVIGKVVSVHDDEAFGKRTAVVFPRVSLGQVREVLVIK